MVTRIKTASEWGMEPAVDAECCLFATTMLYNVRNGVDAFRHQERELVK